MNKDYLGRVAYETFDNEQKLDFTELPDAERERWGQAALAVVAAAQRLETERSCASVGQEDVRTALVVAASWLHENGEHVQVHFDCMLALEVAGVTASGCSLGGAFIGLACHDYDPDAINALRDCLEEHPYLRPAIEQFAKSTGRALRAFGVASNDH